MAHLLFLSHAGADTKRAVKLAAAIEASPDAREHGLKVWVDKRPDGPHRLHAGTPWQDQLETAIATGSTSFGLLLTREGARNWVRLEVRVALDRVIAEQRQGATYPFVPIIADDPGDLAYLPPFAQQYQGVRLTEDGKGLADLVRVAARLDTAQTVRLVAQPFMGLEAFEAKDAALFFGRHKETQDLVDRLRTTNLVLVTGDSGSGKSSLVKAGLIPAFREGALADPLGRRPEPGQWHVVEMRPGADPFDGLVEGAQRAATAAGIASQMILALGTAIRSREPGAIRDALRLSGPPDAFLLLVVDQFEELWTLTTDDTNRRDFLAALLALVPEGDLARRVVGTMRRDYYHLHTDDERLRDRLAATSNAGRFLLGAMAPESLRDIVEKPLLLAGQSETRAAALADEVVKDVAGEPGNLALVEMALHESWERRQESCGDLALAYQRLDRLEGALARAAEEVFWNPTGDPAKLSQAERPVAEALFMRLVRAGDAGGATRRPVAFSELDQDSRRLARKLATRECRRLLVLRETDGSGQDSTTVELAHEQLTTQWPDYRFWLRGTGTTRHEPDPTRAVDKRLLDRLIDAARSWTMRGKHEQDLAHGGELEDFDLIGTSETRNAWLSSTERSFVADSIAARDAREISRQRQLDTARLLVATRKRQAWGTGLAAVLLLLVVLTGWQWSETEVARTEAAVSAKRLDALLDKAKRIDSLRLANLSLEATRSGDALTGLLLALRALPLRANEPDRPIVAELWTPLRSALSAPRELAIIPMPGIEVIVTSVAFSPDGSRILTGSSDGIARIWPNRGSAEPVILRGHSGGVTAVAFSPDGTKVVTGSRDNTARVWAANGTGEPMVLNGHSQPVLSVSFSHDGSQVLTGSNDDTARLWRADGSGQPVVFRASAGVTSVALSPDGYFVAVGSPHGSAEIWPANGRGKPKILQRHSKAISSVAFSPNAASIITASEDGSIRIWPIAGTGEAVVLKVEGADITSAAFNKLGNEIVTGSSEGAIRVWRTNSSSGSEPITILRGLDRRITSVAFNPDGTQILAGSDDGVATVWQRHGDGETLTLASPLEFSVQGPTASEWTAGTHQRWNNIASAQPGPQVDRKPRHNSINAIAYSSDGKLIATASQDTTARLWPSNGKHDVIAVLRGHTDSIVDIAFNSDGSQIVTGSMDGTARLWAVDWTAQPIVLDHDGPVIAVAFTQDGSHVVTGSRDGVLRLWKTDGTGDPVVIRQPRPGDETIAFSPGATSVYIKSRYGFAEVWSLFGTQKSVRLDEYYGAAGVNAVTFSPGGARIAAGTEDNVVVSEPYGGRTISQVWGGVASVSYSRDGTRLAIGAFRDSKVTIWRSDLLDAPLVLGSGDKNIALCLDFNPEGTHLAAGLSNGQVSIWPMVGTLEQLATYARSLNLPRALTDAQKKQYFIIDDW